MVFEVKSIVSLVLSLVVLLVTMESKKIEMEEHVMTMKPMVLHPITMTHKKANLEKASLFNYLCMLDAKNNRSDLC